jgi:hypothetical protein
LDSQVEQHARQDEPFENDPSKPPFSKIRKLHVNRTWKYTQGHDLGLKKDASNQAGTVNING